MAPKPRLKQHMLILKNCGIIGQPTHALQAENPGQDVSSSVFRSLAMASGLLPYGISSLKLPLGS
jgi:hypothetical protein